MSLYVGGIPWTGSHHRGPTTSPSVLTELLIILLCCCRCSKQGQNKTLSNSYYSPAWCLAGSDPDDAVLLSRHGLPRSSRIGIYFYFQINRAEKLS